MGKTYRRWQARTGWKNSKHAKRKREARNAKSDKYRFDPRDFR